jgi:hypothetical protein
LFNFPCHLHNFYYVTDLWEISGLFYIQKSKNRSAWECSNCYHNDNAWQKNLYFGYFAFLVWLFILSPRIKVFRFGFFYYYYYVISIFL